MNQMSRNGLVWLIFAAVSIPAWSQTFIGMTPDLIATTMKAEHPAFRIDKNAVNRSYKYLKYVDKISEQTVLFFLSDDDHCTYVRWMSDYSNLNDMIATLNKKYRKSGENTWTFADKNGNYTVKLEEEEWYFTVSWRKN